MLTLIKRYSLFILNIGFSITKGWNGQNNSLPNPPPPPLIKKIPPPLNAMWKTLMCEICWQWRHENTVTEVDVMSLLLKLNRFHTLLCCFHYWIWRWYMLLVLSNYLNCTELSACIFLFRLRILLSHQKLCLHYNFVNLLLKETLLLWTLQWKLPLLRRVG